MTIKRKIGAFLCSKFGHRFNYYKVDGFIFDREGHSYTNSVRFCTRCKVAQQYKTLPTIGKIEYVWMNLVSYTDLGAKKYVKGYGEK
jgi:hypothetical protein